MLTEIYESVKNIIVQYNFLIILVTVKTTLLWLKSVSFVRAFLAAIVGYIIISLLVMLIVLIISLLPLSIINLIVTIPGQIILLLLIYFGSSFIEIAAVQGVFNIPQEKLIIPIFAGNFVGYFLEFILRYNDIFGPGIKTTGLL